MSRGEEHRYAIEYVKTKDPLLADRLVVANMRLVVALARRYPHADDLSDSDLIQEGESRAPPCRHQLMTRSRVARGHDWVFVFVAVCSVFIWQLLTPEDRVLETVGASSRDRSRGSRRDHHAK
jgi:hypothetical protein